MPIITRNKRTAKGSFPSMNNNDAYIIDLDTGEKLGLQGLPQELNIESDSKFTAINSPGRNTPFYAFSNSEDIVQFELTWFSEVNDRTDVIARCKWLESMTKANGYIGRPHYAKLKWGKFFVGGTWIITSAKYTLKNFHKGEGMAAIHAVQNVGMRRVMDTNTLHSQITNPIW